MQIKECVFEFPSQDRLDFLGYRLMITKIVIAIIAYNFIVVS